VRLNRSVLSLVFFAACLGASTVSFAKTTTEANRLGSSASADDGIREVIPAKYERRYKEWKEEFLSTPVGRQQWEFYSTHPGFTLTITINNKNESGAGSGKYKWNDAGQLIAATISLGSKLDEGFPSAVYYPVMNALAPFRSANLVGGNLLAAAKLAHEFGHILRIATTPKDLYTLQVRLVPVYNEIFLSNGYNVNDPRLVELAKKMGGNPVEIWEDREYWGEANAMLFLRDRVAAEKYHCRLFGKIKQIVDAYAKDYEPRFAEIAKAQATSSCSWR
jgi:hypothetical protein